jgi:anti-anti-sigma factor
MSTTPIPFSELTLEAVKSSEEILVRCSGRITSSTTDTLQNKVRSLIPETECVVLDLTDVNYIDSSGLGALVSVYMAAKRRHCQLKLINLSQRLQELFRITNLSSVFEGHGENYFEGY